MVNRGSQGQRSRGGRRSLLLGVAVAAIVSFPASAFAAQRFAAPTAIGTKDCSTATNACTLSTALTGAASNDTIVVAGNEGTYGTAGSPLGALDVNSSTSGVSIEGAAGQSQPVIYTSEGLEMICDDGGCGSTSDLDIQLVDPSLFATGLIAYGDVDHILVQSSGNSGACQVINPATGPETMIDSECMTGAGPAIEWNASGSAGTETIELRNDTFYAGSFGEGTDFSLTSSPNAVLDVVATNTIFHGGTDDIYTTTSPASGSTAPKIDFTTDHSNFATTNVNGGMPVVVGTGDQTKAPTYVDVATGNLHEAPGSVTIDAGENNTANGSTDLDGNPRTIGGTTDIGAYEAAEAPAVTGAAVSGISKSGAKLTAYADPNYSATTVTLYAGTTTADERPVSSQSIGSGIAVVPLSFSLTGLTPATLYHFHLVGSNALGSRATPDQTFTTTALPGTIKFDSTKPKVKVKGRKAAIKLSCSNVSTGCHGTLTLTEKVKVGRHTVTRKLGHVKFVLKAGQTKTFKVGLSAFARSQLASATNHHLKVLAKVARSDGGKPKSKKLTLVRVATRHRSG